MTHIQLINPNTSAATTELMLAIARAAAPPNWSITGLTARQGPPLIVDAYGLELATTAVAALEPDLRSSGVIVAAFGDPGADLLRLRLKVPVIGIGEASIRAAQAGGRRFSIVTTTPALEPAIRDGIALLDCVAELASIRVSTGDPARLTADPAALEWQLQDLVDLCVRVDRAEAVIVGGGPLAKAAQVIAKRTPATIIEPVPAAVAWMIRTVGE